LEALVSITDELREYVIGADGMGMTHGHAKSIYAIADRIDAEAKDNELFRREAGPFCDRLRDAAAERADVTLFGVDYVALPLDADGVPIRPGDELVIFETGERVRAYDIELYDDGRWLVCDDETMDSIHPDRLRHYHAPTVEDVLDEFFGKANLPDGTQTRAEIIAEYAAKLRLAEEVGT